MFITSLTFTLALASAVAAVSISPKPTLKLEHVYRRSVNMKLPFHYPESVSESVSVQLPVAGLANPSKSQLLASASSYLSDTLVPAECSGSGGGSQKTPGQTPDTPIGTPSRQPGGNPTTTTTLPRRRRTSVPTTKGGRRRRSGRTSITTNTTGGQTKRGGRTSS
ncbi:hypothetical protein BSLG_001466 [Batrachochytrium salamandrivorans]|nr:hypothetical protein BSLG_001466 [Batrachochytrium salamandrivorans]